MPVEVDVTGEFTITPPLSRAEVATSDFRPGAPDRRNRYVELVVDAAGDGGALRACSQWADQSYGLLEDLNRFIQMYGTEHTLGGQFVCIVNGDPQSMWGVVVRDGVIVEVTPGPDWWPFHSVPPS